MVIKTVLGFDFGMKRIGMAVGQTISNSASPLRIIFAKDGVPNWKELSKIIAEWQPQALVVGIPLNIDGSKQTISYAAKKFAKKLASRYKLPIFEVDERLTTVEARAQLFDEGGYQGLMKAELDSAAAVIITEQWLHTKG